MAFGDNITLRKLPEETEAPAIQQNWGTWNPQPTYNLASTGNFQWAPDFSSFMNTSANPSYSWFDPADTRITSDNTMAAGWLDPNSGQYYDFYQQGIDAAKADRSIVGKHQLLKDAGLWNWQDPNFMQHMNYLGGGDVRTDINALNKLMDTLYAGDTLNVNSDTGWNPETSYQTMYDDLIAAGYSPEMAQAVRQHQMDQSYQRHQAAQESGTLGGIVHDLGSEFLAGTGDILQMAPTQALLAAVGGPMLSSSLGGGMMGAAGAGAALGGGGAAINGGNVLEGALLGGLGGIAGNTLFGGVDPMSSVSGPELAQLVESGTTGAMGAGLEGAALSGQSAMFNTGTGALTGFGNTQGTTAFNPNTDYTGQTLNDIFGDPNAPSMVGPLTGTVQQPGVQPSGATTAAAPGPTQPQVTGIADGGGAFMPPLGPAPSMVGPPTGTVQQPGLQASGAETFPVGGQQPPQVTAIADGGGAFNPVPNASTGGTTPNPMTDPITSNTNTPMSNPTNNINIDMPDINWDEVAAGWEGMMAESSAQNAAALGGLGSIFSGGLESLGNLFNSGLGNLAGQIGNINAGNAASSAAQIALSKEWMDRLERMQQRGIDADLWRPQQGRYFEPLHQAATQGIGNTPYGKAITNDTNRAMSAQGFNMSGNQMHEVAQGLNRGSLDYMKALTPLATGRGGPSDGSGFAGGMGNAFQGMGQGIQFGLGSIFNQGTGQQGGTGGQQGGGTTIGDIFSGIGDIFGL